MATPTCQQSVKRTPLTITSDEDSPMCTALDSSTEGEGVGPSGSTEDRSHNGEKIRNAVFWKPREKVSVCCVWPGVLSLCLGTANCVKKDKRTYMSVCK